jgi:protein arginine kinase activator
MSERVGLCRVCGVKDISTSVAIWRGKSEQSRTFVCTKCAEREEKALGFGTVSLARLAHSVAERQARRAGVDPTAGCPACGVSLDQVVTEGLLGCGYCYVRFKDEVEASVRITQGNMRHLGKSPFE